jgi:hypothetical protein
VRMFSFSSLFLRTLIGSRYRSDKQVLTITNKALHQKCRASSILYQVRLIALHKFSSEPDIKHGLLSIFLTLAASSLDVQNYQKNSGN